MHTVGQRLKEWRKAKGLTQQALAQLLDLPWRTYQNYENDVRPPSTKAWESFARAGIDPGWLLTGEGETSLQPPASGVLDGADTGAAAPTVQQLAAEVEHWRNKARDLQSQLDALATRYEQDAGVPLNQAAMRAIITGVVEGMRGRDVSAAQIAERAVELYCRALAEDLITPIGIGKGGSQAA